MSSRVLRNRTAFAVGLAVLLLFEMAVLLLPEGWTEIVRENAFDVILNAGRRMTGDLPRKDVAVVDIDRRALEEVGPWPWPREKMADLVEAVAAARPAVVALDILFSEPDDGSPAALARRLARSSGRSDLSDLARTLPDGDARLANAFASTPTVLGFVLDPEQAGAVRSVPILVRGSLPLTSVWRGAGAVGPVDALGRAIEGLGALSLPANADGAIRRVPLLVAAGDSLLPGLALETVRVLRGASGYTVQSEPARLGVAGLTLSLPQDALLRLLPVAAAHRAERTVSAADLLQGKPVGSRLAGAAVLVGGSAPELGGLRKTANDPLTPDMQIQADAVGQILAGRSPLVLDGGVAVRVLIVGAMGLAMLVAGAELAPLVAASVLVLVLATAWAVALGLATLSDRLVDPLTPSLAALAVFVVVSVSSFAATHRREARVRRSFEQHLAPSVVSRIVDEPDLVKLSGERREVTALFTDVEGFTSLTHRAGPEQLVKVLDEYFEGCAGIVIAHGGMVDKIVGDAVHALFNAPLDLPDHPRCAVACAVALARWSASYRRNALPARLGFGRTRIGIETGDVVVGDVGGHAKLDYTAHGDAVNAAARLEAANKDLGSTICIGPVAASRCDPASLRPLGRISLRGREELYDVFEPWPEDASKDWRERYLAAFALIRLDAKRAAAMLEKLAVERSNDPVPRVAVARLCDAGAPPRAER